MVWHSRGGAGRRGGGRPQLPQVDPARDHHDRRGAGVPARPRATTTASSARFRKAEFQPETHPAKIDANPLLKGVDTEQASRASSPSPSRTYDGVLYNAETIKQMLDGYIDTLHFDEAWLPHAAFHAFYGDYHAIGQDGARAEGADGLRHPVAPTSCWPACQPGLAGAGAGLAGAASSTGTSSTRPT
jgi:hypothetical protein